MAWFRRTVIALCILYVSGDSDQDLKYLASIFPGFYDNIVQYENDIKHHVPLADRHVHLSMTVTPQDVPILQGRTNFYLEEYTNGNPNKLVRQRIYSYAVDKQSEIQLKFYSLVHAAKFVHSKPRSPLFKNLTLEDISYIEGCDVYWDRVDAELFRSHMFNTCVVPFDGTKIIITDTNDLTARFLTVKETWIVASNGTVIRATPVPYNLTKQNSSPEGRMSGKQLVLFEDIHQALVSGHPVRYNVDTRNCKVSGGQHLAENLHGDISAFTYHGLLTDAYISFNTSSPRDESSGKIYIVGNGLLLQRGSIYRSGAMNLSANTLSNSNGDPETMNLKCSFGPWTKRASASFSVEIPFFSYMKDQPSNLLPIEKGVPARMTEKLRP